MRPIHIVVPFGPGTGVDVVAPEFRRGIVDWCCSEGVHAKRLGIHLCLSSFDATMANFQLLQHVQVDYVKVAAKYTGAEGLRVTSLLLGVGVAAALAVAGVRARANRVRHGVHVEPMALFVLKNAVFAALLIGLVMYTGAFIAETAGVYRPSWSIEPCSCSRPISGPVMPSASSRSIPTIITTATIATIMTTVRRRLMMSAARTAGPIPAAILHPSLRHRRRWCTMPRRLARRFAQAAIPPA